MGKRYTFARGNNDRNKETDSAQLRLDVLLPPLPRLTLALELLEPRLPHGDFGELLLEALLLLLQRETRLPVERAKGVVAAAQVLRAEVTGQTGRRQKRGSRKSQTWRMNLWYFQSEGRCETVRRVIPSSADRAEC